MAKVIASFVYKGYCIQGVLKFNGRSYYKLKIRGSPHFSNILEAHSYIDKLVKVRNE